MYPLKRLEIQQIDVHENTSTLSDTYWTYLNHV